MSKSSQPEKHAKFQRRSSRIAATSALCMGILLIGGGLIRAMIGDGGRKCCAFSESRVVEMMIRSQQAFLLDHGRFAQSIDELGINIDGEGNQKFLFRLDLDQHNSTSITAIDRRSGFYRAFGRVDFIAAPNEDIEFQVIICTVLQPPKPVIFAPKNLKTCGKGTKK
jgi:Type IV pilin-like G and H, putative